MNNGEVVKTNIWLDKGDKVGVATGWFYLATENEKWRHEKKYAYCRKSGFLRIKSIHRSRLNNIKVTRNKKWNFKLKTNQTKKIEFYNNDKLKICSNTRYYLNGQIQDKGCIICTVHGDKIYSFKGSVLPANIKVVIIQRRGI